MKNLMTIEIISWINENVACVFAELSDTRKISCTFRGKKGSKIIIDLENNTIENGCGWQASGAVQEIANFLGYNI